MSPHLFQEKANDFRWQPLVKCKNLNTVPDCKTRPYTPRSKVTPTRSPNPLLKTGFLAAHPVDRLMLLGSPPDMVHGFRLRKTHFSTRKRRFIRKSLFLKRGIHPCCSGFQVQGSANSPAGMASFCSLILHDIIITDNQIICKGFLKFLFFSAKRSFQMT